MGSMDIRLECSLTLIAMENATMRFEKQDSNFHRDAICGGL
jgi:hypothetical protein